MVEHVKGQRCRALDWAVALREQHPSEVSEVDIMLQPASNMDGVLLGWTVAQQGSEEPASLHIRDSFAALFHDSVAATQKVVRPALGQDDPSSSGDRHGLCSVLFSEGSVEGVWSNRTLQGQVRTATHSPANLRPVR